MRKLLALGALAAALTLSSAGAASAKPLAIAVYGDSPYGTTPTDTAQVNATPAFIASINADPDVSLVLHVGDIHSGKQFCTQAYDQSVFDLWTQFQDPLVYTPGDNEWTDCHKKAQGGGLYNAATNQIDYVVDANGNPVDYAKGDPIANLDLVRSIFFPTPGLTLGARKQLVLSQAQFARVFGRAHPADAKYVENVLWVRSGVLFVTINLPGGSNNDADVWYKAPAQTPAQQQEIAERTGADLRWLDLAFRLAELDRGIKGVVVGAQADMWDNELGPAHQAAYEPFVQSLASHTTDLGRPVLMFNGDSHIYLSDNPLVGLLRAGLHPPRLSRAELPPGGGARQHVPAGVAEADGRPEREPSAGALGLRPVQLGARDPALMRRVGDPRAGAVGRPRRRVVGGPAQVYGRAMPPKRRGRVWVGFALFATLAILGLFVLGGPAAGATLFVAMVVFIGACIYALRGEDPDAIAHNQRSGFAGWFGGWL